MVSVMVNRENDLDDAADDHREQDSDHQEEDVGLDLGVMLKDGHGSLSSAPSCRGNGRFIRRFAPHVALDGAIEIVGHDHAANDDRTPPMARMM